MRLRHRGDFGSYDRLRRREHTLAARGEVYAQAEGVRFGAFPDGMTYVEGRVAAILDGPDAHYLATPAQLVQATEQFADTIGADSGDVLLGRLDLASELTFEDPREGLALMKAIAAADVPWLKTGTEGSKRDGLETVAWRTVNGRSIQLRLYDKGRESDTGPPGERLRCERQKRMRKGRELYAIETPTLDLSALYLGRELRSLVNVPDVTLCNSATANDVLDGLACAGKLTRGSADLLIGFVSGRRRRDDYTRPTWDRRWASLRALGIALDDQVHETLTVPVGHYLNALAQPWAVAA